LFCVGNFLESEEKMNKNEKEIVFRGVSWWDVWRVLFLSIPILLFVGSIFYTIDCWEYLELGPFFSDGHTAPDQIKTAPQTMILFSLLLNYGALSLIVFFITSIYKRGFEELVCSPLAGKVGRRLLGGLVLGFVVGLFLSIGNGFATAMVVGFGLGFFLQFSVF